jgi:acetyl-CoA synthetase
MFDVVLRSGFDAVGFMLDCPPPPGDDSAYVNVVKEFAAALPGAGTRAVLISSLPESMSAATRELCQAAGIAPLQGQREALEALNLAGAVGETWTGGARLELRIPRAAATDVAALSEQEGKAALAAFGVPIPRSIIAPVRGAAHAAAQIGFPVVIKANTAALEHKSEVGGVIVNVRSTHEAEEAARRLVKLSDTVLVEEMVTDAVAEILVGITVDSQFGQMLVLGAGGILTELLRDSVSLLPPFSAEAIAAALGRLRVARLLAGFRGRPAGDVPALVAAILACTRYAEANLERLSELDLNPVIVRPQGRGVVAVDALIRLAQER